MEDSADVEAVADSEVVVEEVVDAEAVASEVDVAVEHLVAVLEDSEIPSEETRRPQIRRSPSIRFYASVIDERERASEEECIG